MVRRRLCCARGYKRPLWAHFQGLFSAPNHHVLLAAFLLYFVYFHWFNWFCWSRNTPVRASEVRHLERRSNVSCVRRIERRTAAIRTCDPRRTATNLEGLRRTAPTSITDDLRLQSRTLETGRIHNVEVMVYQYDKLFGYGYWMTSISTMSHIFIFLGYSEFPSWLPWQPIQILQYPKSIQQNIKMWDMVQILVIQQPYPKNLSYWYTITSTLCDGLCYMSSSRKRRGI